MCACQSGKKGAGEEGRPLASFAYPCVVELGLHADHLAFFFVLCAQDLQFCRVEGRFRIDGVCAGGWLSAGAGFLPASRAS